MKLQYSLFSTLIAIVISFQFSFGQAKKEAIKFELPVDRKWKTGTDQENESMRLVEIIPAEETFNNWTILLNISTMKKLRVPDMDKVVDAIYANAQKYTSKPKLTIIEKSGANEKNLWVLFTMEMPEPNNEKAIESQVYFACQSDVALYVSDIAVKRKTLQPEFVSKWSKILKNYKIIQE